MNLLERAVSTDINDVQDDIASDRNQLLRRSFQDPSTGHMPMYSGGGSLRSDLSALPAGSDGTVHDCIGGLLVRPDNAGYLLVDSGSAAFYVPAFSGATASDSPYVVVDSAGVSSITELTFTANAGAGPRCDFVECRPILNTVQQSRDIFDPNTQTFSASLVDKSTQAGLEFRIRLGTADLGMPVLDQEWMPIACVVVQIGASGFDACDVYDVRPLVSERSDLYMTSYLPADGPKATYEGFHLLECSISPDNTSEMKGWCIGEFAGNKVGGFAWKNTPSTLANFGTEDDVSFDCDDSDNQLTSVSNLPSNATGQLNVVMALYPRGLRRWVRYSQNSISPVAGDTAQNPISGRLPRGFNGILVLGQQSTSNQRGAVLIGADSGALPATFGTGPHDANVGWIVNWAKGQNGTTYYVATASGKTVMLGFVALAPHTFQYAAGGLPAGSVAFTSSITASGTCFDMVALPNRVPQQAASFHLHTSISANIDSGCTVSMKGPYSDGNGMFTFFRGDGYAYRYFPSVASALISNMVTLPTYSAATPDAGGQQSVPVEATYTADSGAQFTVINNASGAIVGWDRY